MVIKYFPESGISLDMDTGELTKNRKPLGRLSQTESMVFAASQIEGVNTRKKVIAVLENEYNTRVSTHEVGVLEFRMRREIGPELVPKRMGCVKKI